ncbi:bifunctional metallophosphatase/5'-nucleotidase [Paenibacillus sp. MER TA 81-3]|uniref:bifunctional metallophosphatase/5'-nucleotidase n=1 Tax=Paenibacillus sp. MER TA 81-3 TaxID=2939573 RepID=UPI00203B000A|nr:bifunctional UDP-sugar hydrolase/5'-nucleotidase [Paenibacillus sp. MER TA 81-3]MCM3337947.1 bifunctional metallophosphatase/5'-nucleotidase [Paenibacillus sp. MER TA 81-3]
MLVDVYQPWIAGGKEGMKLLQSLDCGSDDSIILLYTNDVHSHWEGVTRLAAQIRQYRARLGNRVLLLDGGDHMDRAFSETEGTYGAANLHIMNALRYDAGVIGNNEGLTFEPERLGDVYRKWGQFPMLAANVFDLDSGERPNWLTPWIRLERNEYRIGIVGVTASYPDYYKLLGWDVTDPIDAVADAVAELRPTVDLLIVLSHCGLPVDERMAEQIDGIDLILGGHTHHLLQEGRRIKDTWLLAAGKHGSYLGVVECCRRAGKIHMKPYCIPTAELEPDEIIVQELGRWREEAVRHLAAPVTVLSEPLAVHLAKPSPLGQLLAQGLRSAARADIGIVNAGQLLGHIPAGEVTEGMLHAICPSPINPVRMQLSGSALRRALKECLQEEWIHKTIRGYGFRGTELGTLCFDGLQMEATVHADETRIRLWREDGREILDTDMLWVGSIDMFVFGAGYLSLKQGENIQFLLPDFLRDILKSQLQNELELERCRESRFTLTTLD